MKKETKEEAAPAPAEVVAPSATPEEVKPEAAPAPAEVVALTQIRESLKSSGLKNADVARVKIRHALEALGFPPTKIVTETVPDED